MDEARKILGNSGLDIITANEFEEAKEQLPAYHSVILMVLLY